MVFSNNIRHLLKRREIWGDEEARKLENKKHVTIELIQRLGLARELIGHEGCVNCLEWNKSGDILASGSDDQTVILWRPQTGDKIVQLSTDHQGNIFSVKFIPHTSDSSIVTGSQDSRVCLIDVEKGCAVQRASISRGRIKRLAVSEETSGIFWSASEDGTVMQWDTREKWTDATISCLIDLNSHCARAEVKCVAVNPLRDEMLAVGSNDQFIRLYDRRKLSLKKIDSQSRSYRSIGPSDCDTTPPDAVKYLVPGHLADLDTTRSSIKSYFRPLTTTYLNFSCNGTELVANMGGDHVYYFDRDSLFGSNCRPTVMETLNKVESSSCDSPSKHANASSDSKASTSSSSQTPVPGTSSSSGKLMNGGVSGHMTELSHEVDLIKLTANSEFERGNYTQALQYYNTALVKESHPILYGNRAAALMKRKYTGDTYAATRDCITTLNINPGHIKALLRLSKCLHELERHDEARKCLHVFKNRYPNHAKSKDCQQLEKEINEAEAEAASVLKSEQEGEADEEEIIQQASDDSTTPPPLQDGEEPMVVEPTATKPSGAGRKGKNFSEKELLWRSKAADYTRRYVGACNTSTDIKEANFFGADGQFIMSGSDDGKIFMWDTKSTNLVKVLTADSNTVNCVQGHPCLPLVASSGIENIIRIWDPRPEDGSTEARQVNNIEMVIKDNQDRMSQDPFEYFISNDQIRDGGDVQCRPS